MTAGADTIDTLYAEAQSLADAARRYFDGPGVAARARLDAAGRAAVAAETLRVTARLIAVVSWVLLQQAVAAGDIAAEQARQPGRRLDPGLDAGSVVPGVLVQPGHGIADASRALYARAAALCAAIYDEVTA